MLFWNDIYKILKREVENPTAAKDLYSFEHVDGKFETASTTKNGIKYFKNNDDEKNILISVNI